MFKLKKINFLKFGIMVSCFLFFFFLVPVFASTNTVPRTEEELLISSDIVVTDMNRANILDTPAIQASEKIYDFADLYTDDEEKELYEQIIQYTEDYQFDAAIVTIHTNSKGTAKIYAEDFYDYNDFGFDDENSGILFLIDMDTREIYLLTTGKAISMYNDVRVEKILDSITPYISSKKYTEASQLFLTVMSNYMKEGSPKTNESRYAISDSGEISKSIPILGILIFSFIVTGIIIVVMAYYNKLVRVANSSREYLKKESVKIDKISDNFLGSNVVKIPISHNTGGGSSTSSGSSGISHGGGGRGF